MKTSLTILLLTLFIANCFGQDIKEDAKSFFKTIVKTYFERDCDEFYSFFADSATIISPNGVGIYSTKKMTENRKACEKFEEFTERLSSFQSYIDEFKIIVLDKKEITTNKNDSVLKQISAEHTDNVLVYEIFQEESKIYTDSDFLIFGNIHKLDSNKNISTGLFWMIVRKTKYGWKIFGTKA